MRKEVMTEIRKTFLNLKDICLPIERTQGRPNTMSGEKPYEGTLLQNSLPYCPNYQEKRIKTFSGYQHIMKFNSPGSSMGGNQGM